MSASKRSLQVGGTCRKGKIPPLSSTPSPSSVSYLASCRSDVATCALNPPVLYGTRAPEQGASSLYASSLDESGFQSPQPLSNLSLIVRVPCLLGARRQKLPDAVHMAKGGREHQWRCASESERPANVPAEGQLEAVQGTGQGRLRGMSQASWGPCWKFRGLEA